MFHWDDESETVGLGQGEYDLVATQQEPTTPEETTTVRPVPVYVIPQTVPIGPTRRIPGRVVTAPWRTGFPGYRGGVVATARPLPTKPAPRGAPPFKPIPTVKPIQPVQLLDEVRKALERKNRVLIELRDLQKLDRPGTFDKEIPIPDPDAARRSVDLANRYRLIEESMAAARAADREDLVQDVEARYQRELAARSAIQSARAAGAESMARDLEKKTLETWRQPLPEIAVGMQFSAAGSALKAALSALLSRALVQRAVEQSLKASAPKPPSLLERMFKGIGEASENLSAGFQAKTFEIREMAARDPLVRAAMLPQQEINKMSSELDHNLQNLVDRLKISTKAPHLMDPMNLDVHTRYIASDFMDVSLTKTQKVELKAKRNAAKRLMDAMASGKVEKVWRKQLGLDALSTQLSKTTVSADVAMMPLKGAEKRVGDALKREFSNMRTAKTFIEQKVGTGSPYFDEKSANEVFALHDRALQRIKDLVLREATQTRGTTVAIYDIAKKAAPVWTTRIN